MRIKLSPPLSLITVFLGCFWMNPLAAMTVTYSGCVVENSVVIEHKQSLLTLLKQAEIQPCAYHFATALTQKSLIEVQTVQKEILLINLQLLKLKTDSEELKAYLNALIILIKAQPITGRVLGLELDSTRVEIIPLQNRVFNHSLKLHFPSKLKSVYFVGSATQEIPYRSAWTLDDYLNENPSLEFFEKGRVHVVQANTSIEKRKIGYWNHNDYYISPGAWVVGLLKPSIIADIAPSLNEELAQWLATQVLP